MRALLPMAAPRAASSSSSSASLAVCVAGELRSASCTPRVTSSHEQRRLVSPIESIASFLANLGEAPDVFAALDEPRVVSATRSVLASLRPLAVHFANATETQFSFERDVRTRMCVKPQAYFQARKLQACWHLISARERERQRDYTHVARLRPDLMMPHTLARQVALHLSMSSSRAAPTTASSPDGGLLAAHAALRSPRSQTHLYGDDFCLQSAPSSTVHATGWMCQFKCGTARPSNAGNSSTPLAPDERAHILTVPPFTQVLMNDTIINDVFWVVDRAHAPPLFDHLAMLSQWALAQQQQWGPRGHSSNAAGRGNDVATEANAAAALDDGGLCGSAPLLQATHRCSDPQVTSSRHRTSSSSWRSTAAACATGGHECMLAHAVASYQMRIGEASSRSSTSAEEEEEVSIVDQAVPHEAPSLRVRYLALRKWSPQVLRLIDADERSCRGQQHAYLCSEKRKVRRAAGAATGAATGAVTGGGAVTGAEYAEENAPVPAFGGERARGIRCKAADLMRRTVHTRMLPTS